MNSCIMYGEKVERTRDGKIFVNGNEFIDEREAIKDGGTMIKIALVAFFVGMSSALALFYFCGV